MNRRDRPNGGRHRRTRLVPVRTRTYWPATRALYLLAATIAAVLLLLAR